MDIGDCPKFQQLVACSVEKIVKAQTASSQSPQELHFRSEDEMSDGDFSGYDKPRPSGEENQGGNGENRPPRRGNVAGGDDSGDSAASSSSDNTSSALPDGRKFLGKKQISIDRC